jgi:F0F1-type ATP synthase assembly protein I
LAARLARDTTTDTPARHVSREASDALAEAAHLVGTPILFGALGYWLDALAGTRPLLMLVLGTFAFVGAFVSTYLRYQRRIARQDEGKPWARKT